MDSPWVFDVTFKPGLRRRTQLESPAPASCAPGGPPISALEKKALRTFTLLSVVAMFCVAGAVGGRLLLTARRTRRLPEFLFGCAFLSAAVGLGIGQLGASFLWTGATPSATALKTAHFGLVVAGAVALHAAVWRVFRPDELAGFLSFALGSCLALIAYGMRIGAGDFSTGVSDGPGMHVFIFAVISGFTWAGIEAIHLYGRLRRQVRLELSDPVAASQIGLWGVAASLCAVMTFVIGLDLLELKRSPLDDTLSTWVLLVTVLGASAATWCGFFPPVALRNRFAANSRA